MSRSLTHLRRALFVVSCAIVFGFGATEAVGSPGFVQYGSCDLTGYAYIPSACPECSSYSGWCDGYSTDCICFG
jgi:hypothetical protein